MQAPLPQCKLYFNDSVMFTSVNLNHLYYFQRWTIISISEPPVQFLFGPFCAIRAVIFDM